MLIPFKTNQPKARISKTDIFLIKHPLNSYYNFLINVSLPSFLSAASVQLAQTPAKETNPAASQTGEPAPIFDQKLAPEEYYAAS